MSHYEHPKSRLSWLPISFRDISYAVWLYHRFCLSFRHVEELLAERGVTVSYEAVRLWCLKFGQAFANRLRHRRGRLGDTWHLDEVFVTIRGQRHYLWRAVDQDGEVLDILVQKVPGPARRQALERERHGKIAKQGRKRLRSIAIRAALSRARHARPSPLRDFSLKKKREKGAGKALCAAARKRLTLVFVMLKKQLDY